MFKPIAFVLLAGLAVAQPPSPGGVTSADVKRLAERLVRLDPGTTPPISPQQVEAIRKLLDANPELKEEVERRAQDFKQLPPEQQRAKLDELRSTTTDPNVKKQLDQVLPDTASRPPDTDKPTAKTGNPTPPTSRSDPRSPTGNRSAAAARRSATDPAARQPPASQSLPTPAGAGSGYEKFIRLWEDNVGKLKDMPAVQQLAQELFRGGVDGKAAGDSGPLADLFDPKKAGDLLKGLPEVGGDRGWKLPDLSGVMEALDRPALSQPSYTTPTTPSAGGVGLFVGLLLLAGLLVVVVRLLPRLTATDDPRPLPGLGPWPINPRVIETRADLVRAFEYLSVLLNGDPARAYSHEAAAAALRIAVPTAADAAGPLADAYALARYTPADRPLAAAEIAAARRHLCRFAGVPAG